METITELTILQVGNKIHAPKLGKDFIILEYKYNEIFKTMLANLTSLDETYNGFTITLKDLVSLGYQLYKL